MLKAVDLECPACKKVIVDYIMRNENDVPECSECKILMNRLYTRTVYKQKHKDREYPMHNLGAGERARFGNKPNFD